MFYGIKKFILDVLFPIYCFSCGAEGEFLCADCRAKILFLYPACPVCKNKNKDGRPCAGACRKRTNLRRLLSALNYDDPIVNELIKSFKYGFVSEIGKTLSGLTVEFLKLHGIISRNKKGELRFLKKKLESFLLIPVPLHRRRQNWRGFNQAEILAETLAKELGIKTNAGILARTKNTSPQAELETKEKRFQNIAGAFEIKNPASASWRTANGKNKIVILIDDVSTTGATLNECARVLKKAGAKQVYAITAARG